MRKFIIDIDNTICKTIDGDYINSQPVLYRIKFINKLYQQGNHITYWTARGSKTGKDWQELTKQQLKDWECLYHKLMFGKPDYDIWIDDKAVSLDFFHSTDHEQ